MRVSFPRCVGGTTVALGREGSPPWESPVDPRHWPPGDFDGCERGWVGETLQITHPKRAEGNEMKIVVIGGTGLIGSKLVTKLRADGHDPLAASPATGVDIITGKGLAEALA